MPAVPAPPAPNEESRLAELRSLQILDTLPEQIYEDIVQLASEICGTPIALVSFIDQDRQWFKARVGLGATETHRDLAFCAHAIVSPEPVFIVGDALNDPRFSDSALVTGDPHIRFYAGAPIVMPDGQSMGTICVIDTVSRSLDAGQTRALEALARQTAALLQLRRSVLVTQQQSKELHDLAVQAAAERARSAELLELALRSGDLGLWDLHVPSGRFTANARECAMLGYTLEDAANGKPEWRSLVHPESRGPLNAAMARHLAGETAFYECEARLRHQAGHWIWVLSRAVVVERDGAGTPVRIVGTHMDICERVAERQAAQSAVTLQQRMGALARVGGWELDLETGKIDWTDEVYRIHEVEPGTPLELLTNIDFYAPPARPTIMAAIDKAKHHGTPWDLELPFVTAKGRERIVRAQGEAIFENGKAVRLCGAFQDITERKQAQQALQDSQRRLRTITDNLPALIAQIDTEERYRFLNAHIGRVFGIDTEATLGRTMREVRSEAAYAALAPRVRAALGGEKVSFVYSDLVAGQVHHYQSNYVPDVDAEGSVRGFYAMTFDITELHNTQQQLERLARVDALTGLPNRRQFDERIEESMSRSRRTKRPMAVLFLDIDHFKSINDSLGHAGGDVVLCEFARRLRACVRLTDTVARLAGDEFVVVLEGVDVVSELGRLAQKVVACIRPPFEVAGSALHVTTSAGVSVYDGVGYNAAELLSLADGALYAAKKQGRDRFVLA